MNYFFVDYENVKNLGLEGIETLSEDDTVIIFYSQNANTITFETHKKLCAAKANIIFERVNVGLKNALDFQLSSYVGYIMGKTEEYEANYYLVTNDAAFSVIGRFWSRKGKHCSVVEKISDVTDNSTVMPALPKNAKKNVVKPQSAVPMVKIEEVFKVLPGEKDEKTEIAETVSADENIVNTAAEEIAAATEAVEALSDRAAEEKATEAEKEAYEAPELSIGEDPAEEIVKIAEVTLVDEPKPAKKKNAPKAKNQTKSKDKEIHDPELESKLEGVLPDKSEIPVIVKIIKQYKTKQGINNALMKQFPSQNNQRSGEIYKAIKPLLTDKKGK